MIRCSSIMLFTKPFLANCDKFRSLSRTHVAKLFDIRHLTTVSSLGALWLHGEFCWNPFTSILCPADSVAHQLCGLSRDRCEFYAGCEVIECDDEVGDQSTSQRHVDQSSLRCCYCSLQFQSRWAAFTCSTYLLAGEWNARHTSIVPAL